MGRLMIDGLNASGSFNNAQSISYDNTNVKVALDNLNSYSTTEKLIGTFLDKPLYRRCFIIPNQVNIPSQVYDTLLDVNADYIDKLCRADIVAGSSAKVATEFVIIYSRTYHTFRALSMRNAVSGVEANSILVCEYTKVGE